MRLGVANWNLGAAPPDFPRGRDAVMRRVGETTLHHSPAIGVIGFQEIFFPANLERLEAVLALDSSNSPESEIGTARDRARRTQHAPGRSRRLPEYRSASAAQSRCWS